MLALFSLGFGCRYRNQPLDGAQQCGPAGGQRCPDGYMCAADNRCYRNGDSPTPDGSDGTDARTVDMSTAPDGADARAADLPGADLGGADTGAGGSGGDAGPSCAAGTAGCACLANGICNTGLTCDQNLCRGIS